MPDKAELRTQIADVSIYQFAVAARLYLMRSMRYSRMLQIVIWASTQLGKRGNMCTYTVELAGWDIWATGWTGRSTSFQAALPPLGAWLCARSSHLPADVSARKCYQLRGKAACMATAERL